MASFNFGYIPNPEATKRIVASFAFPTSNDIPALKVAYEKRDVFLWKPLIAVHPNWKRGNQMIGDCVSWGGELVATMLLAQQAVLGESQWETEVATEAIYGGMRVEDRGGKLGGYSDGWYGSGQASYLNKHGVVLRLDYSKITGNPEHNLTVYSGKKAKEWGNYGCGGKDDKGLLDAIASKHPIKDVTQVKNVDDAASLIDKGCPISICSGAGFNTGDGSNGIVTMRDSNGISRIRGSWAHCMMVCGIRYRSGEPDFRICNSHGSSAGGPDPGVDEPAISAASWWVTSGDMQRILGEDDSFAFSRVQGFSLPPWDFEQNLLV